MAVTISALEEALPFIKGRHELCMVCPKIYVNMCIFMPIYSQLSVLLWGKSGKSGYKPEHKPFILCLLHLQGRGSSGCCAREMCDAGAGASPLCWCRRLGWELLIRGMGAADETLVWGITSSLHSPLCLLLGFVLAPSLHWDVLRSCLGCNYHPPAVPSPRMLKHPSSSAWSALREEGRWGSASHHPTLLLIFPRHPPYQPFAPPSIFTAMEREVAKKSQAHWCELLQEALNYVWSWKSCSCLRHVKKPPFHKHCWMLRGFKWG